VIYIFALFAVSASLGKPNQKRKPALKNQKPETINPKPLWPDIFIL
jgi:hypothetical protein